MIDIEGQEGFDVLKSVSVMEEGLGGVRRGRVLSTAKLAGVWVGGEQGIERAVYPAH